MVNKVLPKGNCSKCGKRRDTADRYCRACRAQYMRGWRSRHVVIPREIWERMRRR